MAATLPAKPMKLTLANLLFLVCAPVVHAQGSETAAAPRTQVVELKGRVTDVTGKPVVGAAVAFAPANEFTTRQLLASPQARTDDAGS